MKVRSMIAALCAAAALASVAAAAPKADAMAMYNSSGAFETGAEVDFDCGFLCGWFARTFPYGQEISYPGKGGSFELLGAECIASSSHPNIEDHGYAELGGAVLNSDVTWSMWGNGGNTISGSPFPFECFPDPNGERPQLFSAPRPQAAPPVIREFHAWDSDRDGTLSTRELRAGVMRDFRQMDLDGNGIIDIRDARNDLRRQPASHRHGAAKTILPFDLDHDGKVGRGEYWRYVRRTFLKPMTHGSDAPVTLAEVKAFYAN